MKNIELLQCAYNALCDTDVTWFEIYGDIVNEFLQPEGSEILSALKNLLGKVKVEDEIFFDLTTKHDVTPDIASLITEYRPSSSIDFFLERLIENKRKLQVKSIMQEVIKKEVEFDDGIKVINDLINEKKPLTGGGYIKAKEICLKKYEPIKWIVDDYIPYGGMIGIAGEPKSGKSTFSLELAIRLASKDNLWLNSIGIKPCKVVYIDAENAEPLIKNRLHKLGATESCEDLFIITRQTLGVGRIDMMNASIVMRLKKILAEIGLCKNDLVVFDSFRRLFSGNENDSSIIADVMANIHATSPASKLILHHLRKKNQDSTGISPDMVRGSGDFNAAVDGLIMVETEGKEDKITTMELSLPRWTSGKLPIQIHWKESADQMIFNSFSGSDWAHASFDNIKKIIAYLKETFESRSMDEIIRATGLSRSEANHALATMVREERVRKSTFERKTYYGLILTTKK